MPALSKFIKDLHLQPASITWTHIHLINRISGVSGLSLENRSTNVYQRTNLSFLACNFPRSLYDTLYIRYHALLKWS